MKVYWGSRRGAVITSANATANGLAAKGLYEAGVMLSPKAVDIDQIIAKIKPRKPNAADFRRIDSMPARVAGMRGSRTDGDTFEFAEWANSPHRKKWKLGWWVDPVSQAAEGKEAAKDVYGVAESNYWLNVAKGQCKAGDWLLTFRLRNKSISQLRWMYVHFIVPISKGERRTYDPDYPFQATQAVKQCPEPPFTLSPSFRSAFAKAITEYGEDRLCDRDSLVVPKLILDSLNARLVLRR